MERARYSLAAILRQLHFAVLEWGLKKHKLWLYLYCLRIKIEGHLSVWYKRKKDKIVALFLYLFFWNLSYLWVKLRLWFLYLVSPLRSRHTANLKEKCKRKVIFFFSAHVHSENFTRLLAKLPLLPHLGFLFFLPYLKVPQSFRAFRREWVWKAANEEAWGCCQLCSPGPVHSPRVLLTSVGVGKSPECWEQIPVGFALFAFTLSHWCAEMSRHRTTQGKWHVTKLRRKPWTFAAVCLGLLNSQDWLCNWVTSC